MGQALAFQQHRETQRRGKRVRKPGAWHQLRLKKGQAKHILFFAQYTQHTPEKGRGVGDGGVRAPRERERERERERQATSLSNLQ